MQPDIFSWVNQSVGIFDPIKRCYRKNTSKFHVNGISDITIIVKKRTCALVCFVELKSKNGKQTDSQKIFENNVKEKKGIYLVVNSLSVLINEINRIRSIDI